MKEHLEAAAWTIVATLTLLMLYYRTEWATPVIFVGFIYWISLTLVRDRRRKERKRV